MSAKQRILVTSALPYINGVKHLGNLAGSMLPADVYARFQRQRLGRDNVLFICATDEHGTPAELAALEEGREIREFCDFWHAEQKAQYERFGIDFDYFGRSSSDQNRILTQQFARTLWEAGFIEERTTRQVYSRADDRFLPDRYVIGTCPHCAYERARGDQCENCTRVLDPADLINPRSILSGSPDIEIRDSKHLFLKQTAFLERLRHWIESNGSRWPSLVTSIGLKWLNEGLQDRGITRDLSWGVRVNAETWGPNPDGRTPDVESLNHKVFYVWFDAPIEYIGATWEWADAIGRAKGKTIDDQYWKRWWKGDAASDVKYVQFMGKDNVPFHLVGFPCTIFGVNEREDAKWKIVDELKGFNWLNYYGNKFSTSQKRGIFLDTALELLPADYWRWYLIANAPEGSDASFTWEHFQSTVNKDLADVLGNFVNRVLRFSSTRFENMVPEGGSWGQLENTLASELVDKITKYSQYLLSSEFRKAASELRSIWVLGNEYLTAAAPWSAIKNDRDRAAVAVRLGINLIRLMGVISSPIIPNTSALMLSAVNAVPELRWPTADISEELGMVKPGHKFRVPDVLFSKIEDSQVAEWATRFGGGAH
jgi:methionyl-tRNA synthetase